MKLPVRGSTALTVGLAAMALFLAGAGGAVAGSLVTSAQIKDGTIQSVDVKADTLLGSDIKNGTIRAADVADYSLSNQDVNVLFASVNSNGTLATSSGGVTSTRDELGTYFVHFTGRNIEKCAYSAQVADLGEDFDFGFTGVADLEGSADGVYLRTYDGNNVLADHSFHLIVVC